MFREECKNKPTNNLGKFYLKRKKKKIAGCKSVCLNCAFKERNPFISPPEFCGKHFSVIQCRCSGSSAARHVSMERES